MSKKCLLGYDNRGTVYDYGKYVLRKINPEYIEATKKILLVYEQVLKKSGNCI